MRMTTRGRSAARLTIVLWVMAIVTSSPVAAAGAFFITLAFAYGLITLGRPTLNVERRLPREWFHEGESFDEEIDITLRSRHAVHAFITESVSLGLDPAGNAQVELMLSPKKPARLTLGWVASTWGRKQLGPLRVVVRDALELIEVEVGDPAVQPLMVKPVPLPVGKFLARAGNPEPALGVHNVSKPGDGFEFFALRGYQPGDSIRRINWKASARSSDTIVNQVTRDSYARVLVIVDLREKEGLGPHRDSAIVRNGRAAASILAHHERAKDHLTVVTVTSEAEKLSAAPNPRLSELLESLASRAAGGELPLDDAIRRHLTSVRPNSPVYLITSGALDPELREAVLILQTLKARPILISPAAGVTALDAAGVMLSSRRAALADVSSLGVRVIEWTGNNSLEGALAAQ